MERLRRKSEVNAFRVEPFYDLHIYPGSVLRKLFIVLLWLLVSTQSKALSGITVGSFGLRTSAMGPPLVAEFPKEVDANSDSETSMGIASNTIEKAIRMRMLM